MTANLRICDVVVVGGGTAGAVAAAELASAGAEVCLVEAGPDASRDPRVNDISRWIDLLHSEHDLDFRIERQSRGNSDIRHSRARLLGGCSAHNSVIAWRTPDADLHEWVRRGAAGWGPEECQPVFDHVLDRVHVELADTQNACVDDFLEACVEAGHPRADFGMAVASLGVGRVPLHARGRTRVSSATAFLSGPVAGLEVLCDVHARRIIFDGPGGAAVAVETDRGRIVARSEVLVCCGAFETPKLLLLSGIGPAAELERHGIPVQVDVPAVGEHLLDHPEGVIAWESAQPVPHDTTQHLEALLVAGDDGGRPAITAWLFTIPFAEASAPTEPGPPGSFCVAYDVAHAASEGCVRLRSANPSDPPIIDPRYFSDPWSHDEKVLVAGAELIREVARQPALAPWIASELSPGELDPVALSDALRASSYTAYHPMGTCRMGDAADPDAVCDPQLRVRGVANVRLGDASVIPAIIGVNPCLTCMMIGARAASFIADACSPNA